MSNFRCLTCGFVQDFIPTQENVVLHHPWMSGKNYLECPACHQYLAKYGGRKNGKIQMPDITTPGMLEDGDEQQVKDKLLEMSGDFEKAYSLRGDGELASLKNKWGNKKLFGFSIGELIELHDKAKGKSI